MTYDRALFVVILLSGTTACEKQQSFVMPEPGLERMQEQLRVDPFQESSFFENRMAMRPVPRGSVPQERTLGTPAFIEGVARGHYTEQLPSIVDRALMARGQEHFDTLCAACHGVDGRGESVVAANMELRKPPSLHEPRIRAFLPGQMLRVVRGGYGLMPGYARQLSVADSWGVVAYVRALQLSRLAVVSALPPELRTELAKSAP